MGLHAAGVTQLTHDTATIRSPFSWFVYHLISVEEEAIFRETTCDILTVYQRVSGSCPLEAKSLTFGHDSREGQIDGIATGMCLYEERKRAAGHGRKTNTRAGEADAKEGGDKSSSPKKAPKAGTIQGDGKAKTRKSEGDRKENAKKKAGAKTEADVNRDLVRAAQDALAADKKTKAAAKKKPTKRGSKTAAGVEVEEDSAEGNCAAAPKKQTPGAISVEAAQKRFPPTHYNVTDWFHVTENLEKQVYALRPIEIQASSRLILR